VYLSKTDYTVAQLLIYTAELAIAICRCRRRACM